MTDKSESVYTTDEEDKTEDEGEDEERKMDRLRSESGGEEDDSPRFEPGKPRKKNILKRLYYSFVPEDGSEAHRSQMGTAGWLRAGVLGANDALVSVAAIMVSIVFPVFSISFSSLQIPATKTSLTARDAPSQSIFYKNSKYRNEKTFSLICYNIQTQVGVAANTNSSQGEILVAGLAGLIAGACSMAVGEFVSVSSQRDLEHADLKKEKWELENNWEGELEELSLLYQVFRFPLFLTFTPYRNYQSLIFPLPLGTWCRAGNRQRSRETAHGKRCAPCACN